MTRLYDTPLCALLPDSIAADPTIRATAASLDGMLLRIVQSVPNVLLYARLLLTAGRTSPFPLLPALQRIINASGGLKALSTPELELLAWQFHVDFREVARTNTQLAEMIVQSIPWHRIKGTPASIINALSLFNYHAEIEEDGAGQHWATYQLGLPQIADIPTVQKILSIAREMQPARCRLWRMYTDVWDMRPAIYSGTLGYSEAYYSLYSGVPVPDAPAGDAEGEDVLVSFGHGRGAQTAVEEKFPHMGIERWRAALCFRLDTLIYGYSCYTDKPIRNHGFARYRLRQSLFEHARTAWHFTRRSMSRIQAVYGESPYGDTNSRYGRPTVVTFDNPSVYGESLYGLHDCQRRSRLLDEMDVRLHNAATAPYDWSVPPHTAHDRQGVHAAQADPTFPPNATWQGAWDARPWRAFGAQTLLTRSIDI